MAISGRTANQSFPSTIAFLPSLEHSSTSPLQLNINEALPLASDKESGEQATKSIELNHKPEHCVASDSTYLSDCQPSTTNDPNYPTNPIDPNMYAMLERQQQWGLAMPAPSITSQKVKPHKRAPLERERESDIESTKVVIIRGRDLARQVSY